MNKMNYFEFRFGNEAEKAEFVNRCERHFNAQMEQTAEKIVLSGARFITLTGPSSSGKTTTSKKLNKLLSSMGKRIKTVSIDDFYRDKQETIDEALAKGEEPDFESASSLDLVSFEKFVGGIVAGKPAVPLAFDFETGKSEKLPPIDPDEYDVFMFEGIQGLYPEILRCFGDVPVMKLYISVEDGVDSPWGNWTNSEIRLLRRIIRDDRTRGTEADGTLKLWTSVVRNEHINIFPHIPDADVVLDSGLPYEVCAMKGDLLCALGKMKESDANYIAERMIYDKISRFPDVSEDLIPADSVLREFVGYGE